MKLKLSRFFLAKMALLVGSMVALTLFSVFASPEGAEETSSTIVTLGTMVAALFGGSLLWSIHKYQNTQLTEAGASQVTMKGKLFVPWEEVQELRLFGRAYILDSARGHILIAPHAYENPFAVVEYVNGHMRRVMEERGAQVVQKGKH